MSELIKTRKERIQAVLERHGVYTGITDEVKVKLMEDLSEDLLTHALTDTVCEWQAKTGEEPEKAFVLSDEDLTDKTDDFHREFDGNFYIPGLGFGVKMNSTTRGQDLGDLWDENYRQVHGKGPNEGRYSSGNKGCFISEKKLMGLVACYLNHHKTLVDDAEGVAKKHLDCSVEGFDTPDSAKDPSNPFDNGNQDYFRLNRSQSSIHIGVCSSTGAYLNGSMAQHQHNIRIAINGPTGRCLCRVEMTMDQFASALVGQGETPCTCTHYWSVNEFNRQLTERVKPPEDIANRLKKRLGYAAKQNRAQYKDVLEALSEAGETGKMGKTKARDLANQLARAMETLENHASFVMTQGTEEASAMIEQSAIFLKSFYGLQDIGQIPALGSTLGQGKIIGIAGDPSVEGGGDLEPITEASND